MGEKIMTEDTLKFIRKYKTRLGKAWQAGMDDRRAARYAGVTEDELARALTDSPELTEYRDKRVDKLLIKAQENIANKINDGDVKVSEWYWEKIRKNESRMLDYEEEHQDEDDVTALLDNYTAGKVSFDG